MKRIILTLTAIFICTIAYAHTINWHVGNTILETTTCDSGESITPPTAPYKYGYHFKEWLPYSARIEYLESTGTQYIDTGFKPNQDTRVIITYLKQSGNDDVGWLFGSRAGQNTSSFGAFYNSNPSGISTDYNAQRQTVTNRVYDKKLIIDKNKNICTVIEFDTGTVLGTVTSATTTFSSGYNLSISAINTNGSIAPSKTKSIYSCKIWDNAKLVRDFIPVLDKDGVPCMYDKVEGKFYYNQGTGQFIAGPVISEQP